MIPTFAPDVKILCASFSRRIGFRVCRMLKRKMKSTLESLSPEPSDMKSQRTATTLFSFSSFAFRFTALIISGSMSKA